MIILRGKWVRINAEIKSKKIMNMDDQKDDSLVDDGELVGDEVEDDEEDEEVEAEVEDMGEEKGPI
ncbi:MAG TPA: hypothetical protein VJC12_03180 [Candidatus Paceibacterota bacterium]